VTLFSNSMTDLPNPPTPFVTFYSYKGGVGRSMAVLNVSALLAARGFRVLVIDFDLEAPGLSHLLLEAREKQAAQSRSKKKKPALPCAGVVEFLADAKAEGSNSDLFSKPFPRVAKSYTFDYPIPEELHAHRDGRLIVMPAGKTDGSYSARLNKLDLAGLYQQGLGQGLMRRFKQALAESGLYDYVIIDSRTGHSDEAGICTRDLADHLMIVSGFNRQNLAGTASFLSNLRATLNDTGAIAKNPTIILSPVPIGEEQLLAVREAEAQKLFSEAWGSPLPIELFIPYHPRLALTEDAYVTTRTASYLRDSYQEIEIRLLMAIEHLPGPLLAKARAAINGGNGPHALAILGRYAKLQATSSESPTFFRRFPFGWQRDFDLEEDDALLGKVLVLPEAEAILRIYAEAKTTVNDLFKLGRKLHERGAPLKSMFDDLILGNQSTSPGSLGNYANFLTDIRAAHDVVEVFYKRALEADPDNATNLGNYAIFLTNAREDHDGAEILYMRALEIAPKHANNLGDYANFLTRTREDHDGAEALYKRALEVDSKHAHILSDYGQYLIGRGRNNDGVFMLRQSWEHLPKNEGGNAAEFAYALWLGSLIAEHEEPAWEGAFKHLILKGFKRHKWSFEAMLARAKEKLDPETYLYAEALASAFLDESKVADLEKSPRWRDLQPLDPNYVTPDGESELLF
jgi:tetratricopeptide (TPR) repeat protein